MTSSTTRGGWRFWLVTVAAVAGMLVTASLGRWQLGRAAQKEALQAAIDARERMPALDGASLPAADGSSAGSEALVHRAIALRGRWVAGQTVFLDNRQMHGRPGFFVLTPLRLEPGPGVVLVQRGWVPRDFLDRSRLPRIETPEGPVAVTGRIALPPSRLYEFTGADGAQGYSRIRQNLDLNAFRAETGLALAPLTVLQTGEPSEGLLRDWPVVGTGVEKHYGYAFQWFGLCGLIALLYVWFQLVRRPLRPRRQPAP